MRIYSNSYELMSETGRNLWEMGQSVKPKSYQNQDISGKPEYETKELICQQNCLTGLGDDRALFAFDHNSRDWAEAELKERLDSSNYPINPGTAWELRKDLWEQFLHIVDTKLINDYTYNQRIWSQESSSRGNLAYVIEELKRNPDTRQGIVPIYSLEDPAFIGGKRRVPCSMYYNFMIREDANGNKVLHICYHQRSCDFVTHFGNDVWLAWKLMEWVSKEVGVKPGYLYHTIDSLHSYKKDWDMLKTPLDKFLL